MRINYVLQLRYYILLSQKLRSSPLDCRVGALPSLSLLPKASGCCKDFLIRRSRSNSAHRFITILLLSNSPNLSPWCVSFSAPATLLVSPQVKSSKCQYAHTGNKKFQIGRDSRYTARNLHVSTVECVKMFVICVIEATYSTSTTHTQPFYWSSQLIRQADQGL